MIDWPKRIISWTTGRVGYMSIPFTWLLPEASRIIEQNNLFVDQWTVGGPAVELMPSYLSKIDNVNIGVGYPGVLQKINPMATRTTVGCPCKCKFCAVGQGLIEPGEPVEMNDWPDLPIICDNNLLASSSNHFSKVIERLIEWEWADFQGGIDPRIFKIEHAEQIALIKHPIVRLSCDDDYMIEFWENAYDILRSVGIAKNKIRTYVLIGFNGSPEQDWKRCRFIDKHGVAPSPLWFHELDALEFGQVTEKQKVLGWTKETQQQIMGWYYKHRGTPLLQN